MSLMKSRIDAILGFPFKHGDISISKDQCRQLTLMVEGRLRDQEQYEQVTVIDAAEISPDQVREWLRANYFSGSVSLLWVSCDDGVMIPYDVFVTFYDDLWYPSSDDVYILDAEASRVLSISHEEVLTIHRKRDP